MPPVVQVCYIRSLCRFLYLTSLTVRLPLWCSTYVIISSSLPAPPSLSRLLNLKFLVVRLFPCSVVPVVVRRSIANTTICGPAGEEHYIPKGASVYLMIKVRRAGGYLCRLLACTSKEPHTLTTPLRRSPQKNSPFKQRLPVT